VASINYSNVTQINELIKSIVNISRQVNLAALNAMFVSRRGGERTLGFATVTTEMRKFSHGLDRQMQRLANSLTELILVLSQCKKAEHTAKLMHKALEQSVSVLGIEVRREIEARLGSKLRKISTDIEQTAHQVFVQLEKSETICNVGQTLAVLAKIEAQSGGEYEQSLMNVSNSIETIINNIETNLKLAKQYTNTAA